VIKIRFTKRKTIKNEHSLNTGVTKNTKEYPLAIIRQIKITHMRPHDGKIISTQRK
jgi:hypothetical protein